MKTLVIYTSQTGFTKRYAEWIANRLQAWKVLYYSICWRIKLFIFRKQEGTEDEFVWNPDNI